ncbi:hypothetical protein GC163_09770 [bacterium]|nr:hypothetical protein [bacterium]
MSDLESALRWLPAVILLIPAFYLLVPWLIYCTQRMNGHPDIVPLDMSRALPKRVTKYLRETSRDLSTLGYEGHPCLALPNPMPNVVALVQLWIHPQRQDAALVSMIFGVSEQPNVGINTFYTEFLTRFDDTKVSLIQTNNTSQLNAFPDLPNELSFRFPMVKSITQLDRLHQKLVKQHAPRARKLISLYDQHDGDLMQYIHSVLVDSYRKQEATGYLQYDENRDDWRPTVWGAMMMTWGQLWPMTQVQKSRIRQRAEELLAELGETVEILST